ncbi:MAG: histidine phosphatase family protein, partial [Alphaproteobacteria bacterium]
MQVPLIDPAITRVALRDGAVVWLVRHGETEWNAQRRLQGQQDSPLTARGRQQASAIASLLARTLPQDGTPIRLVSSPLGRTLATAAPIAAALGLEAATDARLAEIALGEWEGMTWAEIDAVYPGALDGALPHERYFRAVGGESHRAMAERLGGWLGEADGITVA